MNIFTHTIVLGDTDWTNETITCFSRVPAVGEYITLLTTGKWYQVCVVVHTPHSDEYSAEIYAVAVEHDEVMRRVFHDRY
ncbi:MAG: hypothetical protein JXA33_24975 [Anaerolineae bacterium]|nr:hypothetical protein [Anaerolineae bacterium]